MYCKYKIKTFLFLILLTHLFCLQAYAARSMLLPPIGFKSVHGGKQGTHSCISADMLKADLYGEGTVAFVYHLYILSLKNIYSKDQHVSVTVEKDSFAQVFISNSSNPSYVDLANPKEIKLTSDQNFIEFKKTIPANGHNTVAIHARCDNAGCAIGPLNVVQSCCSGTPAQVCIMEASSLNLKITVDEDEGAILGYVYTMAHRAAGYVDHPLSVLPTLNINGGRPF
ncbi:MAG: hypothetical protein HQK52_14275 [Oligoflexia bacterium]|nr:hypothetical protein [Oligoflexia bacterium]